MKKEFVKKIFDFSLMDRAVILGQIVFATPLFFLHNGKLLGTEYGSLVMGVSIVLFCCGLYLKRYDSVYADGAEDVKDEYPLMYWWGVLSGAGLGLLGYAGITIYMVKNLGIEIDAGGALNFLAMLTSVVIVPFLYAMATQSWGQKRVTLSSERFVRKLSRGLMIPAGYVTVNLVYELMMSNPFQITSMNILILILLSFLFLAAFYAPVRVHEMFDESEKDYRLSFFKTAAILAIHVLIVNAILIV